MLYYAYFRLWPVFIPMAFEVMCILYLTCYKVYLEVIKPRRKKRTEGLTVGPRPKAVDMGSGVSASTTDVEKDETAESAASEISDEPVEAQKFYNWPKQENTSEGKPTASNPAIDSDGHLSTVEAGRDVQEHNYDDGIDASASTSGSMSYQFDSTHSEMSVIKETPEHKKRYFLRAERDSRVSDDEISVATTERNDDQLDEDVREVLAEEIFGRRPANLSFIA